VGLTVEIKLRVQISLVWFVSCLRKAAELVLLSVNKRLSICLLDLLYQTLQLD